MKLKMKNVIMISFVLLFFQFSYGQNSKNRSEVKLVHENEPGKRFELVVTILDINTKKPVPDAEVFTYQTNSTGDYEHDKDGLAKINGTAYSNAQGNVKFYTIYPRGYNNAPTGEHMHFKITAGGYTITKPTLVFADYHKKRYDYANPKPQKVYLKKLEKSGDKMLGEAIIYLKRK